MGKKSKEAKRKEKKQRTGRKHSSLKPHEFYEVSDSNVKRTRRSCPRCGQGTWLAQHKKRAYCGKCGYTEFEKSSQAPSEQAPSKEAEKQSQQAPVQEGNETEKQ